MSVGVHVGVSMSGCVSVCRSLYGCARVHECVGEGV